MTGASWPRSGPLYIEELVEPPPGTRQGAPPDFKFFMFGGTVGGAYVAMNRGTADYCIAWVDAKFRRVDRGASHEARRGLVEVS